MNRYGIGIKWLYGCMALCVLIMIANALLAPMVTTDSFMGFCLPSPNLWLHDHIVSHVVNALLVFGAVPFIALLNKQYNFVQGGGMVMPAVFILFSSINFFVSSEFCSATVVLWLTLLSLWSLFGTAGKSNATQDYFLIATFLSVGSMVQYAFIPGIAAFLIAGFIIRSLHPKELMAYLLGLVAPYWVAVGLGLVPLQYFRLPQFSNLFTEVGSRTDLFVMIVGMGIAFLISALICMNNAVRLYAGNSTIRRYNNAINVAGFLSALCMMIDFNNLFAYAGILNFFMAVQLGNLFALNRMPKANLLFGLVCVLCLAFYAVLISLS